MASDPGSDGLVTPAGLRIKAAALSWRFSRSSGPGGQHVNTSDSRAELRCEMAATGLAPWLLERITARLGPDIRVVASSERSQLLNRREASRRLADQLDSAAQPPSVRHPTRTPRRAARARLENKRRTAQRKSQRKWNPDD